MPLITCPDCQTEISDTASSCIKCGRPMGDDPDKDRKGSGVHWSGLDTPLFRKGEKIQKVEVVKPKKKLFSFGNIISVILVIFFVSLFASSSDDSSTSTSPGTTGPRAASPAKATPTPKVTPTPRVYTPTPTLCLKVAPSVIRTLNARARYGAQLDVNSGWAIKRTSAYSDGHFIAAKYTAPAAKKGRVDAFYTDTIANPTYILPASQAATMGFPSTFSFTVKELIGNPEGFQEYYDAVECAMR
jgi:hypothetical protein